MNLQDPRQAEGAMYLVFFGGMILLAILRSGRRAKERREQKRVMDQMLKELRRRGKP